MLKYRPGVAAALGSVLLVGMASGPAAAADQGRLVFVNGRPRSNVEVCVNGKEVKSSLRFGRHAVRMMGPGGKALTFRKSGAGTCRGDRLGQTAVELAVGGDWVVLLTRREPNKVIVWDALEAQGATLVIRHGADVGTVGFKWTVAEQEGPWFPTADAPYVKGQWGFGFGGGNDKAHIYWAHQPPAQDPIAGPITIIPKFARRTEGILIGTSLDNVGLKVFSVANLAP